MHTLTAQVIDLWRARSLCGSLTRREIASRYVGTALGAVWVYAQPLLTIAAYYVVFDVVFAMRLGGGNAPTHAVGTYLIAGMLPWMAYTDALQRAMNSLIESATVLQKNALPPMLFPLRAVLASSAAYAPLMLLLVLAYMPLHHFSGALVVFPIFLILQMLLCVVWGAVLAIFTAALRDTVQVVGFALSLGIFLSPVLFPVAMFPADWRWLLWLNPMTAWITGYQGMLLQGAWPDVSVWAAALCWVLVGIVLLEILLRRSRDQLTDWL